MTTNLPARADGTHLTLAGEHARARRAALGETTSSTANFSSANSGRFRTATIAIAI